MNVPPNRSKRSIPKVPSDQAKFSRVVTFNLFPLFLMILLILFVKNDYFLTIIYISIIGVAFALHYKKKEWVILVGGMILSIFLEYILVSIGTEAFHRNSLFGIMPLWLPFLWGYSLVVMKRLFHL